VEYSQKDGPGFEVRTEPMFQNITLTHTLPNVKGKAIISNNFSASIKKTHCEKPTQLSVILAYT
jgi:hypothetical protein